MGKYSEEAKKASEQTDEALKADIEKFVSVGAEKISVLFPTPSDKDAVDALIAKISKITNRNEVYTAVKVCSIKLTAEGLKALKSSFEIAKKALV